MGTSIIIWGGLLMCMAAARSFGPAAAIRTLLGVSESLVTPGVSFQPESTKTRANVGSLFCSSRDSTKGKNSLCVSACGTAAMGPDPSSVRWFHTGWDTYMSTTFQTVCRPIVLTNNRVMDLHPQRCHHRRLRLYFRLALPGKPSILPFPYST